MFFRRFILVVILINIFFTPQLFVRAQTVNNEPIGACIPSTAAGIARDNITQVECPPPDRWIENDVTITNAGLCIPTTDQSTAIANTDINNCANGTFVPNDLPASSPAVNTPATTGGGSSGGVNQTNFTPANITEPKMQIPIPGVNFTSPKDILTRAMADGTNQPLYNPYIAEYIRGIYQYAIMLAAVFAMLMIIVSGFQWATSGGNSDAIGAAKTRIGQAVTGLIIVLGSYTLLSTINPALVNLVPLKIDSIAKVDLSEFSSPTEQYVNETTLDKPESFGTVDPSTLEKIPIIPNVNQQRRTYYLLPETLKAFQEAMKELEQSRPNYSVLINSAFRSADDQYKQYIQYYKCPPETTLPNDVDRKILVEKYCQIKDSNRAGRSVSRVNGKFVVPTSAGHYAGNALDIQITRIDTARTILTRTPCNSSIISSQNVVDQYGSDSCVAVEAQELIAVMLKHGFCVPLHEGHSPRESWHFELVNPIPAKATVDQNWCIRAGTPYVTKEKLPFAFP